MCQMERKQKEIIERGMKAENNKYRSANYKHLLMSVSATITDTLIIFITVLLNI